MRFTGTLIWPLFCMVSGVAFMIVANELAPILAQIFG